MDEYTYISSLLLHTYMHSYLLPFPYSRHHIPLAHLSDSRAPIFLSVLISFHNHFFLHIILSKHHISLAHSSHSHSSLYTCLLGSHSNEYVNS